MGIGYTVIVDEKDASRALKILAEQDVEAYQIGHIVKMSQLQLNCWGITMVKIAILHLVQEVTLKI